MQNANHLQVQFKEDRYGGARPKTVNTVSPHGPAPATGPSRTPPPTPTDVSGAPVLPPRHKGKRPHAGNRDGSHRKPDKLYI